MTETAGIHGVNGPHASRHPLVIGLVLGMLIFLALAGLRMPGECDWAEHHAAPSTHIAHTEHIPSPPVNNTHDCVGHCGMALIPPELLMIDTACIARFAGPRPPSPSLLIAPPLLPPPQAGM